MRQLWMFMFVFYECFNYAVQALVAAAFGRQQWEAARATFYRCLQFACLTTGLVGATLYPLRQYGVMLFT